MLKIQIPVSLMMQPNHNAIQPPLQMRWVGGVAAINKMNKVLLNYSTHHLQEFDFENCGKLKALTKWDWRKWICQRSKVTRNLKRKAKTVTHMLEEINSGSSLKQQCDSSLFFFPFISRGPSGCVIRLWQHPWSQPQWQQWCSTCTGGHRGRKKPCPECHPPPTNTSWGIVRPLITSVASDGLYLTVNAPKQKITL